MIGNKYIFLAIFLVSLLKVTSQVKFGSRVAYNDYLTDQLGEQFEQLGHLSNVNEYVPIREKKAKGYKDNYEDNQESETAPLLQHERKNFRDNQIKQDVCKVSMFAEENKMIDSKLSITNGAKYLTVEKIQTTDSTLSMNLLQEKCKDLCCDDEICDTSLLSLKLGEEGYRCYLFKCSGRCIFIKHSDYVVLRSKTPEQTDQQPITTGHNQNKDLCNKKFEFKCLSNEKCIPIYDVCDSIDHCDDKSDELNCTYNENNNNNNNNNKEVKASSKSIASTTKKTQLKSKDNDQSSAPEQEENEINDLINDYVEEQDEMKLLNQQNQIIEHLNQLDKQNNKVHFKTPKDFLDSFMKSPGESAKSPKYKTSTYSTRTTKKPTTANPKVVFHDGYLLNSESMYEEKLDGVKISFESEDKNGANTMGLSSAIILLIVGCALVLSFFVYVVLSTNFVSKKIKWLRDSKSKKNLDVDGDYLINGMYL